MDYVRLARDLKSMGKGCFVEHFELFMDRRLSRAAKVARLQAATGYTAKSCQNAGEQGGNDHRRGTGAGGARNDCGFWPGGAGAGATGAGRSCGARSLAASCPLATPAPAALAAIR